MFAFRCVSDAPSSPPDGLCLSLQQEEGEEEEEKFKSASSESVSLKWGQGGRGEEPVEGAEPSDGIVKQ